MDFCLQAGSDQLLTGSDQREKKSTMINDSHRLTDVQPQQTALSIFHYLKLVKKHNIFTLDFLFDRSMDSYMRNCFMSQLYIAFRILLGGKMDASVRQEGDFLDVRSTEAVTLKIAPQENLNTIYHTLPARRVRHRCQGHGESRHSQVVKST